MHLFDGLGSPHVNEARFATGLEDEAVEEGDVAVQPAYTMKPFDARSQLAHVREDNRGRGKRQLNTYRLHD